MDPSFSEDCNSLDKASEDIAIVRDESVSTNSGNESVAYRVPHEDPFFTAV